LLLRTVEGFEGNEGRLKTDQDLGKGFNIISKGANLLNPGRKLRSRERFYDGPIRFSPGKGPKLTTGQT
jgi:hypothetical protein